jgi:hypothetical protein
MSIRPSQFGQSLSNEERAELEAFARECDVEFELALIPLLIMLRDAKALLAQREQENKA